jgi:hypothetical protein
VDGLTVARWLLGAAQVGSGPTAEQVNVITNLLRGYFGVDADAATLEPMDADDLVVSPADPALRRRLVDLLIVVEFCRHPAEAAQADRVERFARALDVDEPLLIVARDALTAGTAEVMADWSRFHEELTIEPGVGAADRQLASRLRALADCPAASLGRAYFDFHDGRGIPFPGEPGGGQATLVAHDFSHVLAGYEPVAPGEVALEAMLTSATGFEYHFSGLVASLALFETGNFEIDDVTPKVAALNRPGAAAELAEAFRRGEQCTCDFSAIDHLERADESLDTVRADCGITVA